MTVRRDGEVPAGVYHVTTRGAGPMAIYKDDLDRTIFCNHLVRRLKRYGWRCLAFCLMTTHYHLLLDVPPASLPAGMQALNGRYSFAFNQRHGRTGHLFGKRYYAAAVETDGHMLQALR